MLRVLIISVTGTQDRFRFDVELPLPVFSRLVRYRGWLQTAVPPAKSAP